MDAGSMQVLLFDRAIRIDHHRDPILTCIAVLEISADLGHQIRVDFVRRIILGLPDVGRIAFRLKRLKHAIETDSSGLVLDRIQFETRRVALGPSDQSEKAMRQFLEVAVEERIAFHGWALFD
jgi:hypothetical protein